jgi:maltooligosyltrehalose trehalohydrolase
MMALMLKQEFITCFNKSALHYMDIGARHSSRGKTRFVVWSPLKEKMILHIVSPFERKIEMIRDKSGYFFAEEDVKPGCRYFLMPDGEKDLPDPASKFQPEGVHGPSEVADHFYQWSDNNWRGIPFDDLILYELHIGTFTEKGTFEAAIAKLDHLIETGINAIEVMPVAQFPGDRNWGYDGVFPYAVQNSYGGVNGLKKLVDACHQKGIAVFLDVVYNHLGPEGNYLEEFGPYFTAHYKTPWGKAINLDGKYSDGVREFFSDNALYWFEHFHIDGLRFDAIHGVYDFGAVHFWVLMHEKIKKLEQRLGRPLHTIAESDLNDPKVIKPPELGGYGFTAQWMDDFHHAVYTLVDVEQGKKLYADFGMMEQLVKAYKDGFVHSGEYVNFRKRKFGAPSAGISGNKFVVFIDNHDQAGNRVTGSCLASLISYEKIKLASAACLLSPYIPMLFMGEEYGDDAPFFYFISHGDEELIRLVQEGRKTEFEHFGWDVDPPDPYDKNTFHQSKLQWTKTSEKNTMPSIAGIKS